MNEELRKDPMMARLEAELDAGTDIGHYGRLVFSMIARHFMSDDELIAELQKDRDFTREQAERLLTEVKSANYSPPRREKILDFQSQQEFPIIEDTSDPDAGNVYKHLRFPDEVYDHIAEYRDAKAHAHAS